MDTYKRIDKRFESIEESQKVTDQILQGSNNLQERVQRLEDNQEVTEAVDSQLANLEARADVLERDPYIDILFADAGQGPDKIFVEIESPPGFGVSVGSWRTQGEYHVLRIHRSQIPIEVSGEEYARMAPQQDAKQPGPDTCDTEEAPEERHPVDAARSKLFEAIGEAQSGFATNGFDITAIQDTLWYFENAVINRAVQACGVTRMAVPEFKGFELENMDAMRNWMDEDPDNAIVRNLRKLLELHRQVVPQPETVERAINKEAARPTEGQVFELAGFIGNPQALAGVMGITAKKPQVISDEAEAVEHKGPASDGPVCGCD